MTIADLLNSEAVVALITGVLAVIGIAVGEVLRRQHNAIKAVREDTSVAREQTANSHKTNLRDDIDRVLALSETLIEGHARQENLLRRHGEELGNLRTDLAWERRERIDLAARLTRHIDA